MFLGEKILEMRLARHMSQALLAHLADTSTLTIRRIEKGRVSPHAATLRRIAIALEVSPDFFWIWIAMPPKSDRRRYKRTDQRERELVVG